MQEENRNLTDADVKAIVSGLEESIIKKLRIDVGKGVISIVWKSIIYVLIAIAAYGAYDGINHIKIV
jgi:hypothetical protein